MRQLGDVFSTSEWTVIRARAVRSSRSDCTSLWLVNTPVCKTHQSALMTRTMRVQRRPSLTVSSGVLARVQWAQLQDENDRGADRKVKYMPKFVIEREIPGASKLTEAEITEASLRSLEVLRELGPEIQWIQSYVTDDKIYCIYFAPDETLIMEHARRGGFAADRVAAVRRLIDPANFQ